MIAPWRKGLGVEVAKLAQAGVFGVAHYDMVEDFDFEKLPGAYQVAGDFYIGFARRGVSARVVVHQNNGGGGGDDGQPENGHRVD